MLSFEAEANVSNRPKVDIQAANSPVGGSDIPLRARIGNKRNLGLSGPRARIDSEMGNKGGHEETQHRRTYRRGENNTKQTLSIPY
jgi:hypothetical protein